MGYDEIGAIQRLGHVLGWTGNLLGGGLVALGIYTLTLPEGDNEVKIILVLAPGVGIFLVGRALRYIFAGPDRSPTFR